MTFNYYFNKHFPLRKCAQKHKAKNLHVLRNKYPTLDNAYRIACKEHAELICKSKKEYFQSMITNSNNTTKALQFGFANR